MIYADNLDVNVVLHCNNRCASCSHASPLYDQESRPLDRIKGDLLALKPFMSVGAVHIVGGEPLLHKEIAKIMRMISDIRIDKGHRLFTNGLLLHRMKDDFWGALETLRVSVYPNTPPANLELAQKKSEKYGFELDMRPTSEFFKQLDAVPDGSSFNACPWRKKCFTVHDAYFYLCSQATFYPQKLMGLPQGIDGLSLDGATEEKISAFMQRDAPFNTCHICRPYTVRTGWHQSSRKTWVADSTISPNLE